MAPLKGGIPYCRKSVLPLRTISQWQQREGVIHRYGSDSISPISSSRYGIDDRVSQDFSSFSLFGLRENETTSNEGED